MRLKKLESGHALGKKVLLKIIRLVSGHPAPDVVRTLLYRGDFFGTPYSDLLQDIMRGPAAWTVGEREIFAAFVSCVNRCKF